jgi:hypothetical protein
MAEGVHVSHAPVAPDAVPFVVQLVGTLQPSSLDVGLPSKKQSLQFGLPSLTSPVPNDDSS